jgi:peptide/nickel transport system permease protein
MARYALRRLLLILPALFLVALFVFAIGRALPGDMVDIMLEQFPSRPSWGGMLSGSGLVHMLRAPWLALWPDVALSLFVFGARMLGDASRDLLDPRLRGNG